MNRIVWRAAAIAAALSATTAAEAAPAPGPLRVHAAVSVLEAAPLLLAAEASPAGTVLVRNGGVPNLWRDETERQPRGVCQQLPQGRPLLAQCAKAGNEVRDACIEAETAFIDCFENECRGVGLRHRHEQVSVVI